MINNDIQRVIRCNCSGGFWEWKEDEKREREKEAWVLGMEER